ncbi:hypothetical protein [Conexibacter sp. CPCC 206217]|uniref:hypothetical protein n=1 Tax=Conexibacter sp. CPCC 206217 TaxID=3064574 RepID=UPI0027202DDB|nr:hypothetical protein [Conexibacter sp. CPCC 206217]MDO8213891.1 hypothetical protein [Conexibacter sp. CPCC 206217]
MTHATKPAESDRLIDDAHGGEAAEARRTTPSVRETLDMLLRTISTTPPWV